MPKKTKHGERPTPEKPTSIVRANHGKGNPYFMLHRDTAQDKGLSWAARGVLAYLLSQANDWIIMVKDLEQHCKRDKVYAILEELEKAHYLTREEVKDGQWEHGRWHYCVYERPYQENPATDTPVPCQEKPATENPATDETAAYIKEKEDSQNTESTKEIPDVTTFHRDARATDIPSLANIANREPEATPLEKSEDSPQDVRAAPPAPISDADRWRTLSGVDVPAGWFVGYGNVPAANAHSVHLLQSRATLCGLPATMIAQYPVGGQGYVTCKECARLAVAPLQSGEVLPAQPAALYPVSADKQILAAERKQAKRASKPKEPPLSPALGPAVPLVLAHAVQAGQAETDLDMQLMLFAILRVTGLDFNIVPSVRKSARTYRKNHYAAEDVVKAQQLCIQTDWRWKKNPGQRMTLQDLTNYLGQTRVQTNDFKYDPEMELDKIIRRVRATGDIRVIDPAASPLLIDERTT